MAWEKIAALRGLASRKNRTPQRNEPSQVHYIEEEPDSWAAVMRRDGWDVSDKTTQSTDRVYKAVQRHRGAHDCS